MDIDPNQPWGVAIDYAGRAQPITEGAYTVNVQIHDREPGYPGTPVVEATILAQADDGSGRSLFLAGVTIDSYAGQGIWEPDPAKVQQAVTTAVAQADTYLDWIATLRPAAT